MLVYVLCVIGILIFGSVVAWGVISCYKENKELKQKLADSNQRVSNLRWLNEIQEIVIDEQQTTIEKLSKKKS